MSDLEDLYNEEAQRLAPVYAAYRLAPSSATGQSYYALASNWLARAHTALQRKEVADQYYIPVSSRFDTVVRSVNFVSDAGHAPKLQSTFLRDVASGLQEGQEGLKGNLTLILGIAAIILVIFVVK